MKSPVINESLYISMHACMYQKGLNIFVNMLIITVFSEYRAKGTTKL